MRAGVKRQRGRGTEERQVRIEGRGGRYRGKRRIMQGTSVTIQKNRGDNSRLSKGEGGIDEI